jgi:ribosomal protein L12E/L44/L45/RPP1/RPP2
MIDPQELMLKALREALESIGVDADDTTVDSFLTELEQRGYVIGREVDASEVT